MDAKMMFLDYVLKNDIHIWINELLAIYPNNCLGNLVSHNELITKGTSLYIMNYLMIIEDMSSADPNFALKHANNIIDFFSEIPRMTDILNHYLPHQHARNNVINLKVESYNTVSKRLSDIIEIKENVSNSVIDCLKDYYQNENSNLKKYEIESYQKNINAWIEKNCSS